MNDLEMATNPNTTILELFKVVDQYPEEVQGNPSLPLLALENPELYAAIACRLQMSLRIKQPDAIELRKYIGWDVIVDNGMGCSLTYLSGVGRGNANGNIRGDGVSVDVPTTNLNELLLDCSGCESDYRGTGTAELRDWGVKREVRVPRTTEQSWELCV